MARRAYLPLLAAGALSLLAALAAGLFRAGWALGPLREHHPLAHGPLLICGFLGTLISLEKAVAVGRLWGFLAPGLAAVGGLWLMALPQPVPAALVFALASTALVAVCGALLHRRVDLAGGVMLAGALAWLAGNVLWATGRSIPLVTPWWLAFPTLVIVGERLELSRVVAPLRSVLPSFLVALTLYAFGLGISVRDLDAGLRLQGVGLLLLAGWLVRHDLARRTVRLAGLHRYTALCLLSGYLWLASAGAMALVWGANLGGLRYDALLHALFLGFVFGMIFGHAPIIAPMLLGRQLAWGRHFYGPLAILQASLLLRLVGDLADWLPGRSWGGLFNVVAVLLFLALTARAALAGRRL